MKILLDTHAFLWLLTNVPETSERARNFFLDKNNDLFLSLASVWEMAIKISLGKLTLSQSIEKFIPTQLQENSISQLDINFRHVTRVASFPFHHRDPFDRLIISQAIEEKMSILGNDAVFDLYGVERLW